MYFFYSILNIWFCRRNWGSGQLERIRICEKKIVVYLLPKFNLILFYDERKIMKIFKLH